jgi:hypothetical protein
MFKFMITLAVILHTPLGDSCLNRNAVSLRREEEEKKRTLASALGMCQWRLSNPKDDQKRLILLPLDHSIMML